MLFKKFIQAIKRRFRKGARKPRKKSRRVSRKSSATRKKSAKRQARLKAFARTKKKPKRQKQRISFRLSKRVKKHQEKPKEKRGQLIGEITHFFSRIRVCVIKITAGRITIGDRLRIQGHTSNFIQKVQSLQIENTDVKSAGKGSLVGLKVDKRTRSGDKVFKLPS
jgi:putative protease